jgi:imidazolonepropionase-like amidohydrolase
LLGTAQATGSIDEGKFADIVAVVGDPLNDINVMEHVTFVMTRGTVIKDEVHLRADH